MIKIYLITKLYNLDDKIRTCELEKYLKENFEVEIYMPFRDTKEENISQEKWKSDIFKEDIIRLNECDIVVGFNEFVFDEGIGFEIGYALSIGKTITLFNSDFISYSVFNKQHKNPDPLFEYFDIQIVKGLHDLDYDRFCDSLKVKKQQMLNELKFDKVKEKEDIEVLKLSNTFLEIGNCKYFYELYKDKNISKRLVSWDALGDIKNIKSSKKVYVVLDGHQIHIGSSMVCGLCYGWDIPFYMIDNRTVSLVGKELMRSNLMIDVATSGYISMKEFLDEYSY